MARPHLHVDTSFDGTMPWVTARIYGVSVDTEAKGPVLVYVPAQGSDEAVRDIVQAVLTGYTPGAQNWPELLACCKDALAYLQGKRLGRGEVEERLTAVIRAVEEA
jgi:uncharacterized protein CbrC (UPF0167 family)